MKDIILTGIKPTGKPHIGNYFGAIKPAIEMINNENSHCYYFIADYHALTTVNSAKELCEHTYEIASTWLACGLDPNKVVFYKQSDIPEIFELTTILTNVTPKGLMNRAHAYKAMVEENRLNKMDDDNNVNMGLFNYPILMTSDIVMFNANKIPVGLDQKQHIEIARDIASYFNKKFGKSLIVTNPLISEEVAVVLGTDGRKMSKSYNNTIPMFCSEKELKEKISKIVTDSKGIDEPKGTDNSVYTLYKLFATKKELLSFEQKLNSGISWGTAKNDLFELVNKTLKPIREKYDYYMQNKHLVDIILKEGATKARVVAGETLKRVRIAIGVNQ